MQPATEPPAHGPTGKAFVLSMIGLSATLVLGMVSLVFYRSQSIVEPTAAVIVNGDPSLDGAEIRVTDGDKLVAKVALNAANQFQTPVLLQPGWYQLRVSLGDKTLLSKQFSAEKMHYVTFDLPTALVVQGDATMAGAVVQIFSDQEPTSSSVLDLDDGYSAISYHIPGKVHIVVAHDGRVIRDQILTLAIHKPRRISLLLPIDVAHFSDENL
jgi:hypothetical protein